MKRSFTCTSTVSNTDAQKPMSALNTNTLSPMLRPDISVVESLGLMTEPEPEDNDHWRWAPGVAWPLRKVEKTRSKSWSGPASAQIPTPGSWNVTKTVSEELHIPFVIVQTNG